MILVRSAFVAAAIVAWCSGNFLAAMYAIDRPRKTFTDRERHTTCGVFVAATALALILFVGSQP